MEGLNARSIHINETNVIHALQHEMRRIVIDVHARMVARSLKETFERCSIKHIFAGVQFVGKIHAKLISVIQDRLPASG